MGTATQKYSLKWNDFTVNVASTFRDLHSRHDFVDVTLACADGSTLEAHKVILSSVSTYFRDILKTTPCKHPIIILKDTGRDEASAMLEFAYTGEVNVAQELLQSFLHMAKSFRIKGLDKVECPVDPPSTCQRMEAQTPSSEHWVESAPPTRSHSPSSIHSQQDVKPPFTDHFMASEKNGLTREPHSPPPSLPNSRPPTREPSPVSSHSSAIAPPPVGLNPRTPPPKRWKRSFDLTHSNVKKESSESSMIPENYSRDRNCEYETAKRFCEPTNRSSSEVGQRLIPYPHSLPTSPTMFERGNEIRLAGLIRHHLANDIPRTGSNEVGASSKQDSLRPQPQQQQIQQQQQPPPPHPHPSHQQQRQQLQQPSTTTSTESYDPVDYRCYNGKNNGTENVGSTDTLPAPSVCNNNYPSTAGGFSNGTANGSNRQNGESEEREGRTYRMVFRPESAPTVLDMSPERSLSGPPSVRNMDLNESSLREEEVHSHLIHSGDELSDCVSKAFSVSADGLGRYSCDECGKIFKHPGSLQHHRHIHRGTHRCPSCGKAFSRRWDMERHLNKSKYGCPANRFSTGSSSAADSPPTHHVDVLSPASSTASAHNTTA